MIFRTWLTKAKKFIAFISFLFSPGFFQAFLHQASANFGSIWTFCAEMRERVKGTLNSLAIVLPSPGPDNMTSNPPRCRVWRAKNLPGKNQSLDFFKFITKSIPYSVSVPTIPAPSVPRQKYLFGPTPTFDQRTCSNDQRLQVSAGAVEHDQDASSHGFRIRRNSTG